METEIGTEAEESVDYPNTVDLQLVLGPQLLSHTEHSFRYKEVIMATYADKCTS